MGRLNTMTDNIATQTIVTAATYGPANETLSIAGGTYFGAWAGETRTYNSLKQLTALASGTLSINYTFPSTYNNGKISSQTDTVSGETVTYTYDALNRLATAENQSTFSPSWGQGFTYDGFGNLTNTSVIQGSAPSMTASYDYNNHAGGEDANGNPGYVPDPAFGSSGPAIWDVENRLLMLWQSTPVMSYAYDPANKRVWRGTWTGSYGSYTRGSTDEITFWSVTGQKLATYNVTTSGSTIYATQSATNYYFGAKLIKNNHGWVYADRLGSIGKFYPYGIERPSATTNGTEKFTGYFRDSETGNDYADQRYISPGYGRFVTPDRGGHPRGTDPGSWNRYAYTRGDPVNRRDPSGRDDCGDDGEEAACVYATGYTLSTEDDEALEEADSLPLSPCYGDGIDPSDLCIAWMSSAFGITDIPTYSVTVTAPGPYPDPFASNTAQNWAQASTAWAAGIAYVNGHQKGLLSSNCGNLISALGITEASWLQALNSEVPMNGAQAGNVSMASLFSGTPDQAIANYTYRGQSIELYLSKHPADYAVAQLNGHDVYLNTTSIGLGNPAFLGAVALHEALHNLTGLDDTDLEVKLKPFGGQIRNPSSITAAISSNCF